MTRRKAPARGKPQPGEPRPGEKAPVVAEKDIKPDIATAAVAERDAMEAQPIAPTENVVPAARGVIGNTEKTLGGITGKGFMPGNPGGPGRGLGTRNKLAEDFLRDMAATYREFGPGILRDMATSKSMTHRRRFIELVHDLLPRNAVLDVNVAPVLPKAFAEMTSADWEIALGIRVTKRDE
jgi:hypothetical protein